MIQRLISTTLIFVFASFSFAATPRETSLESFAELKKKMEEMKQTIENNEAQAAHITLVLHKLKKVPDVDRQDIKALEDKRNAFLQSAKEDKLILESAKKGNTKPMYAQLLLKAQIKEQDQTNRMESLLKEINEINDKLQTMKDQNEKQSLIDKKEHLEHQAELITNEIIETMDVIVRYTRLLQKENQENTALLRVQP